MMKDNVFSLPVSLRSIATITLIALVAWAVGLPAWIHNARAANVEEFSDTLSDSDLGVDSLHTLQFTLVNAVNEAQTIRVTFDAASTSPAFDLTGLLAADLAISAVSGGPINQVANVGACSLGSVAGEVYASTVNVGSGYVEYTMCGGAEDDIPADTVVEMVIGGVTNKIANPIWAGSYVIRLGGTMTDSGDTMVAIIDDVTVTATVETEFTFAIVGVGNGVDINEAIPTVGTSTPTTIPFGVLTPTAPSLMAQELRVDTNALNGFSVTVQADQTLTAGNGATIDTFRDAANTATPEAWGAAPLQNLNASTTWGHWGFTTDDDTLSGVNPDRFYDLANYNFAGNFVGNPVEIFYHNTPVTSSSGPGIGSTTVAYKTAISVLQEAANDYVATLTYIATPVF